MIRNFCMDNNQIEHGKMGDNFLLTRWMCLIYWPINIHHKSTTQTDNLYTKPRMRHKNTDNKYNYMCIILWLFTLLCLFSHRNWIERQLTRSIYIQLFIHYSNTVDLILRREKCHNVTNSSVRTLTVYWQFHYCALPVVLWRTSLSPGKNQNSAMGILVPVCHLQDPRCLLGQVGLLSVKPKSLSVKK